jgi:transmembrane sensor
MDYSRFTVEDFALDRKFRKWVLAPDAETNLFWSAWLERHPNKRKTLQEARTIVLNMPKVNYGWNQEMEDKLWGSIREDMYPSPKKTHTKVISLHAAATLRQPGFQRGHQRWSYYQIGRVAAVILLVVCAALSYYIGIQNIRKSAEKQFISYITKETPWGTKERFYLPDGTFVILNAGSTLRYPEYFSDNQRLIEIEGEAFLEVAKDAHRPFGVKSGEVVTEALGTAFNVRNFGASVEIALVEGKVQVSRVIADITEAQLILLPGEKAYMKGNATLAKGYFNAEQVIAWKEGVIFLESAKEQDVIEVLEQWYGIKIITEGKAARAWRYSGKFKNKSLEYILRSIGYTMDFTFRIEDQKVTIRYQ